MLSARQIHERMQSELNQRLKDLGLIRASEGRWRKPYKEGFLFFMVYPGQQGRFRTQHNKVSLHLAWSRSRRVQEVQVSTLLLHLLDDDDIRLLDEQVGDFGFNLTYAAALDHPFINAEQLSRYCDFYKERFPVLLSRFEQLLDRELREEHP